MEQTITGTLIQQIEKLSADQLHLLFPKIKEAFLDFLAASYAARQEPAVKKVWVVLDTPGNAPLIGQKQAVLRKKVHCSTGIRDITWIMMIPAAPCGAMFLPY